MSAPKRLRPLLLPLKRCWAHAANMDVTQLDVFRFCRFLRHVGKVGSAGDRERVHRT